MEWGCSMGAEIPFTCSAIHDDNIRKYFSANKERVFLEIASIRSMFSGLLHKLEWDSHMVSIRVNVWFDHRRASRSSQLYGPNDLVSLLFSYYPS